MARLKNLFKPIRIGEMKLRNRIVMAACDVNYAAIDGTVTKRAINFWAERAKGGAGLVIVEASYVDSKGKFFPCQIGVHEDVMIPGLRELARAIKINGAKAAIQLGHGGKTIYTDAGEFGQECVAPSAIPYRSTPDRIPRELTIEEIEGIIEAFAEGARRAKKAEFDAVEFHGAHGYLLTQFFSPYSNKRTDKYGGNFENRMSFALEIVERTREIVGEDFPLWFRISGDEFVEGGNHLKDTKRIAKKLEEANTNAINVSGGSNDTSFSPSFLSDVGELGLSYHYPRQHGYLIHLAEGIKKVVDIPVITAGGIHDPVFANKIISEERADLVAMCRPLLADPELPKKAFEGRLEDIRKCILCGDGCLSTVELGFGVECSVNVACGREDEYRIREAKKLKKVLVVGGGPGGMEAARVAKMRGHEVILCEKRDKLGGQLVEATVIPFKEDLKNIVMWLSNQLKKLDVKIIYGKEVKPETVAEIKPDVVIVATGVRPLTRKILGIERNIVVTGLNLLAGNVETGENVVVMGGGLYGCDIAMFLAEKGKKVTMITKRKEIAPDAESFNKCVLVRRLNEDGVKTMLNVDIAEVTGDGIVIVDKKWKKHLLKADTIVNAIGFKPNDTLVKALEGQVPELYTIGDCVKPRKILNAIHEGAHFAHLI